MKNILGMVCSPRKLGNSEILVKEVSNWIEEPHQLNILCLPDFDIRQCTGCYKCLFKQERCKLEDDLYTVLEAIANADALILAVPTYFLGPNSVLKRLLDRGLSFYGIGDRLWNKPAVGIAVAGLYSKEGYTLLGIENFLKCILADIKKTKVVYGALPGEVFLNREKQEIARDLAQAIFTPGDEYKENQFCPVCGGSTFRFNGNNRIQCMLCSNQGEMEFRGNQMQIRIEPGEHELFSSREAALEHKEWLRNKVTEFAAKKDELKSIVRSYTQMGHRIEPPNRDDPPSDGQE